MYNFINLYFSHSLVEDTKRLVSSAGGTQEQLAQAARLAVKTIQIEAEHVKLGAMSLTTDDVEAQVSHYISLYFTVFSLYMYISVSTRVIYNVHVHVCNTMYGTPLIQKMLHLALHSSLFGPGGT